MPSPMKKCSPKYANECCGSCFSKKALQLIINAYNRKHQDKIKINTNSSKKDLWEEIHEKMKARCGKDETCWLDQDFLKSMPCLEDYFKPLAPLGRYQWLTTDDIYKVMNQYQDKYPDFKFVGPLPMDFLSLGDPDSHYLQRLNLNREKYDQIGIIFNLDPSTKSGSHWVAMNINIPKRELAFFDSYGDKHTYENVYNIPFYDSYGKLQNGGTRMAMPKEVQKFVKKLYDNGAKGFTLRINTIQHQYANSECGIYSMMFLLKSRTKSFSQITQDIVVDEMANQFRDEFFRRN